MSDPLPRFRVYLTRSLLVYSGILIAGMAFFLFGVNKLTEDRIQRQQLQALVQQDPGAATEGLFRGAIDDMPAAYRPALRAMAPGFGELEVGDLEAQAFVHQEGSQRRYVLLMLANDPESADIYGFVLVFGCAAVLLAAVLSFLLARAVSDPVERIARLTESANSDADASSDGYRVRELQTLADRIRRFTREQRHQVEREAAFAQDVSHELRTPITVIQGVVDVLRDRDDPTLRAQRIERIERAVANLHHTTETLLSLSRQEQQLRGVSSNFTQMFYDLVEQVQQLAAPGVRIDVDYAAAPRVQTWELLVVALQALLSNAVAHTNAGSVRVTVDAHGASVQDTGSGVAEPLLQQLRDAKPLDGRLGWSIVRRICARCGWNLGIESPVPGALAAQPGTKVTVTFQSSSNSRSNTKTLPSSVSDVT